MSEIDIEVQSLELSAIQISKPKRTDDSLFGKMTYNNQQLNIHFHNLHVLKHKKVKHLTKYYTVLFLKVPKFVCKKMIDFDNHCIDQVQTNISGWFAKALDENVIEEYYTTSVLLNKENAYVLKLKLQGADDILECGQHDIVVSLKGLRFYKQRFIPEWELIAAQPIENDFLNSIDSDEDNWEDEMLEQDIVPEPDAEQVQIIFEALHQKISSQANMLEQTISQLQSKLDAVTKICNKMDDAKFNLSVLNSIEVEYESLCLDD